MRFRLDQAFCLVTVLGLGFGAALPAHGEKARPTKVGKDRSAKEDKGFLVANDSGQAWTFGVLLQDKENGDTKGKIEIWQAGPDVKGKGTLVMVTNWPAAGAITLPPGAEILVAPKPPGVLFRDPIQRTCYVKDSKGAMVYFALAREVKDKRARIDYLSKSKALYGSQWTMKTDEEVTTKAIGNALVLELGAASIPLLTIKAEAMPKAR